MKRKTRLALSAALGLCAAAITLLYVASVRSEVAAVRQEAAARYGGDVVAVCVATQEIDLGETVDEGDVRVEEWVSSLLPTEALTSLRDALGKTATSRIPKGAPLSAVYFEQREGGMEVPRGLVALSVPSDAEHAVGGVLARGDRVDVYVSKDALADRLASAEVLDTSILSGGGDLSWVTLAVNPAALQELLAAMARGSVHLVVPGDGAGESEGGA